ncbi:MAG TPA: argininosuccinate lyase [Archaeoglobaceae archaeon]|nr:argininosuccinate lyase [Archaeoglobaceae archaeon]
MKKGVVRSRFDKKMDESALLFSSSLKHDESIFYYAIMVDLAHTINLLKSSYIEEEEARKMLNAIIEIRNEGFETLGNYEDIHEAIEAKLIEKVGDTGRKIQTGKSRNDEIATCLRLFTRDRLLLIMDVLNELRSVLLKIAKENMNTRMPGYTHLQPAQPTKLSHHLIAYHDMFMRDFERATQVFTRINKSPLGSAAFTSTSFEMDRREIAYLTGFDDVVDNTADAVSSRDFLIESVFVAASTMLTLSRMAEEIILWSSEFDFIELPDEFSSSSSIMPQKKNPDIAELIRAKTGRMIGNLAGVMAIYKALPFTYNRDFQEMNSILYDCFETCIMSTGLMAKMLENIKFKTEVMTEKSGEKFTSATELANMLVRKAEIPFRSAHEIVGKLALTGNFNPSLNDLEKVVREVTGKNISSYISDEDLEKSLNPESVVEAMKNLGGTAKEQIERMLKDRTVSLEKDEKIFDELVEKISDRLEMLYSEVSKVIG